MKRIGLFLASLAILFMITACGGKEKILDCSKLYEKNKVSISDNYLFSRKKNGDFKSAIITQELTVDDSLLKIYDLEAYKDVYKKSFEEGFKSKNMNLDKLDYDVSTDAKNKITMKISLKDSGDIEAITGVKNNSKANFEKTKSNLEAKGYTCKEN